MAAGVVATAAGAAAMLYLVLSRWKAEEESSRRRTFRAVGRRWPAQAPANLHESIATLSETLRFAYSETLGKWPIADLVFGINYFMRNQLQHKNHLEVASVFGGSDCIELKGPEIITELRELLRLLTLCMFFSKKPFPLFLDSAGFSMDHVLLHKPKAELLKPAFTIIRDTQSKCFILLIRGTHSIKDTLTAATGAVVPFHHSVLNEQLGISNLVLGYAHCGMVAAARWIAKLCIPTLLKALGECPDFEVKIVGHSLGGGTAALLAYILREQKELSSSTCVAFAPAACMTWELAESGKHFTTTIINGSDLVPTFSTSSVDDLRSQVTASSWLNDLRDQVEHHKVLNVVYRSATALGSRLQSISSAKTKVASAGAVLWPVTNGTQVMKKHARGVAEAIAKSRASLSCMGGRRQNSDPVSNKLENLAGASLVRERKSESCFTEEVVVAPLLNKDEPNFSSGGPAHDDTDCEEQLIHANDDPYTSTVNDITEGELWYKLEEELRKQDYNTLNLHTQEEDAAAAKERTDEENQLVNAAAEGNNAITTSDSLDSHRFYPPGRIMHVVSVAPSDDSNSNSESFIEERVCLYETPRQLYSKIRLSKTMINDHYMPTYKKQIELLIQELEKKIN